MDWFKEISKWYSSGFWTDKMVQNAVLKNKITQNQADEIMGG